MAQRWDFFETGAATASLRRRILTDVIWLALGLGLVLSGVDALLGIGVFVLGLFVLPAIGQYAGSRPGLALDGTEIRLGDIRRAERREAAGRSPWPAEQSTLRPFQAVWAVRLDAVRGAVVVDGPPSRELRGLGTAPPLAGRRQRRRRLGFFLSQFAAAQVVLRVDLAGSRSPASAAGVWRGYTKVPTASYYVQDDLWAIPTNRPADVRRLLESAGIPAMDLPGPST